VGEPSFLSGLLEKRENRLQESGKRFLPASPAEFDS
jgi:hypothetical protein